MSVMGSGLTRAQVGAMLHPGYPPGKYQWMLRGTLQASVALAGADVLRLVPIRFYRPITLVDLAIRVQTAAVGSAVKIALWRNDYSKALPTGVPVFGSDTDLNTATSSGQTRSVSGSYNAPAEIHWFGCNATGASMPTLWCDTQTSTFQDIVGDSSMINATNYTASIPYGNDIMGVDLTSAILAPSTNLAPICRIGWA